MTWQTNPRTGATEWIPDANNQPNGRMPNQEGSFTPEHAATRPLPAPTSPITPWGSSPGTNQYWYDPSAALLGQQQGFAQQKFNEYDQRGLAADARQAPQADYRSANETRMYGNEGRGLMAQRMLGLGMSPGQQMLQQGYQDTTGANIGTAASARGGPQMAAMAARNAQGLNANALTDYSNRNALLRAQEMEAGRNAFFGATSGQRGMDVGRAQWQSDQDLMQRAANDQRLIGFMGLGQQTLEGERNALINQQGLLFGNTTSTQSEMARDSAQRQQEQQQATNQALGYMQGAAQTGTGIAAARTQKSMQDEADYRRRFG